MKVSFIARAMCEVTDEVLWQPRRAWALKHNATADLVLRVGSGKQTCVRHAKDTARDARLTLTYGKMMVADVMDPDELCRWRTSREVFERNYFDKQLTLLNVLAHTIAHEFGHVVQNILGRRHEGSVHNQEFYAILDRIHSSGEAEKVRAALHQRCMDQAIDLRLITASQAGLNVLSGLTRSGEKPLSMAQIKRGQQLWITDPAKQVHNPVRVLAKLRTRISVRSGSNPTLKLTGPISAFSDTPV